MNNKGICDNCGKVEGTKYWNNGNLLCDECFLERDKKDKKMREELQRELISEKVIKTDGKKKGTKSLLEF